MVESPTFRPKLRHHISESGVIRQLDVEPANFRLVRDQGIGIAAFPTGAPT
jgi:hypothetical protein